MTEADFIGPPCSCPECRQAGVSGVKQRRDPYSGAWLHGYALRRLYEARRAFYEKAKALGYSVTLLQPTGQRERQVGEEG